MRWTLRFVYPFLGARACALLVTATKKKPQQSLLVLLLIVFYPGALTLLSILVLVFSGFVKYQYAANGDNLVILIWVQSYNFYIFNKRKLGFVYKWQF